MTDISGQALIDIGYRATGKGQWQKGYSVIKYDGTNWAIYDLTVMTPSGPDSKEIKYMEEIK